jgi:polyferredoxin
MSRRVHIISAIILGICVGAALFLEWKTTPSPKKRAVHVEAFRYGTYPWIIRSNRGDHLILTFSTLDTGHSFFLQDYRIDAKISPASEMLEIRDPFSIEDPPLRMKALHLTAGLEGIWGRLVSLSRFRCHVFCGPMHGFEQGDLIVRPNWLFSGTLGLLLSILVIGFVRIFRSDPATGMPSRNFVDLNVRFSFLDKALKWRPLQFFCTLPFLAGLVVVIMAGLLGTKVGGRNAAVMLTWVACMSLLTIVLVPLGGRIWCMICPLPVLGEYLQRGATTGVRSRKQRPDRNRFLGLGLRWPHALRNRWLQVFLFMGLGTFSASLAGQPRWTAITLLVIVVLAIGMSFVWELRSFCRYVCPVAAYISSFSLNARLSVRKRNRDVCRKCKSRACLRGNSNGWSCPYGLCVFTVTRNADCGICTECFKSCPHDNVSLQWRKGGVRGEFQSYGEAWQAIALTVLGAVYSLTVHSPWPGIRDIVNVVDKADWSQFGLYAVVLWMLALGVLPLLFWLLTSLGLMLGCQNEVETGTAFKATMPAVLPLGIAMWAVFFADTVMTNFTFVLMTLSDPFGWGWDLFGTAGMPWIQVWPSGVPWIQAGCLLVGIGLSLRNGYRRWLELSGNRLNALRGFLPASVVFVAITAGMLTYVTNL